MNPTQGLVSMWLFYKKRDPKGTVKKLKKLIFKGGKK